MIEVVYKEIKKGIPESVRLIAVSKTKSESKIESLYNLGQRDFGENKVQELTGKAENLPKDIKWHMIGHLQSNKVKYIAPFVDYIHSIDSLKLLSEVNKEAAKNDRTIKCLLQFHIADEETKYGLNFEEAREILESLSLVEMRNVNICGIMGMATFSDDKDKIRNEFQNLEGYFQILKSHFFKYNDNFKEISMGMSSDYQIAVEEGSTMVRIGSLIFAD